MLYDLIELCGGATIAAILTFWVLFIVPTYDNRDEEDEE